MECSGVRLCIQGVAYDINRKVEMNKSLVNLVVMVALAATICLPGMAQADYVANWVENGWYGDPPTLQTWNTAEAFLLSPGTWIGTGLTINSGTG